MATSQGVNVLRYSALVAGLVYGAYHQSSLNAHAKAAEIEREYKRKEALIEQAKAEWRKKNAPPEQKAETGGIITDPEDSRFDLEAYLNWKAAETSK
ncbi:ATP synthase E chain-domain-containing protein [Thermoascus aurantiacus ATCC 26904]